MSAGIGNVASALLGGMPMCHGAGGLTAHVRLGARTAGMNLLLGGALLAAGLFFAPQVPVLLGLLPVLAAERKWAAISAVFVVAVLGLLLEFGQALVPGRGFEWLYFLADNVGVLAGVLAGVILLRTRISGSDSR